MHDLRSLVGSGVGGTMNVTGPTAISEHTPSESRISLTSHGELELDKKVQVTVDSV